MPNRVLLLFIVSTAAASAQTLVTNANSAATACVLGGQPIITQGLQSVTLAQVSYPGCQIDVYYTGTQNHAPIYANNAATPTPQNNPFNSANPGNGAFQFYWATGICYDVTISPGNSGPLMPLSFTWAYICPGAGGGGGGSGTVTDVNTGAGLTGGPITTSGTISIPNAGVTNNMLVNPYINLTAGAGLTGGGSVALGATGTLSIPSGGVTNAMLANSSVTIGTASGSGLAGGGSLALGGTLNLSLNNTCISGQILSWSGTAWICSTLGTGTVSSVGTGAGLTGGPITTTGTISIPSAGVTNAMLANPATTVNSQTCTLGSTCTVPFQTNSTSNTSQAGINNETSSTNAVGLTVTPTNTATNVVKYEITGSSYTGNAATATNASELLTGTWAAPGAIGGTTPAAGTFTNLTAANIYSSTLSASANPTCFGGTGGVLTNVGCSGGGGGSGTVTSVATGSGLTGGPITTSGTISIPSAGVTNAMLANGSVTVTAGTGLSGGGTVALGGTITLTNNSPSTGGTVTSVATGAGLTGGPVTTTGTLSIATLSPNPAGTYIAPTITLNGQGQTTGAVGTSLANNTLLKGNSSSTALANTSIVDTGTTVVTAEPVTVGGIVDTGITTSQSTATICPNGTGGLFTTTGCAGTTSTSLSTNSLPKANGPTSLINSLFQDTGTVGSYQGTGGFNVANGGISIGTPPSITWGSGFGFDGPEGTAPSALGAGNYAVYMSSANNCPEGYQGSSGGGTDQGCVVFTSTQTFKSITTTGTSGAASLSGGVLNIPNYASAPQAWFPAGTDSGTGTAYVVTSTMASNGNGYAECFQPANNNSSTTPTLAFNGLAALTIKNADGSALITNELQTTGQPACVVGNGSNWFLTANPNFTGAGEPVKQGSPIISTPQITQVNDSLGGNFIKSATASASNVNGLVVTAGTTGNGVTLAPGGPGSDTNITLTLAGKGTGGVTAASIVISGKCAANSSSGTVACGSSAAGSFSCDTSTSAGTCVIDTSAIAANSALWVQPDSSLGTLLGVTCNPTADTGLTGQRVAARSAGTSFALNMGTFTTHPMCFSYGWN